MQNFTLGGQTIKNNHGLEHRGLVSFDATKQDHPPERQHNYDLLQQDYNTTSKVGQRRSKSGKRNKRCSSTMCQSCKRKKSQNKIKKKRSNSRGKVHDLQYQSFKSNSKTRAEAGTVVTPMDSKKCHRRTESSVVRRSKKIDTEVSPRKSQSSRKFKKLRTNSQSDKQPRMVRSDLSSNNQNSNQDLSSIIQQEVRQSLKGSQKIKEFKNREGSVRKSTARKDKGRSRSNTKA